MLGWRKNCVRFPSVFYRTIAFDYLKLHPGIAFLGVGLCLVSYGLHEGLGAHEENRPSWTMLKSLSGCVFFLALNGIGCILILFGILEMVVPAVYHDLTQHVISFFPHMPE